MAGYTLIAARDVLCVYPEGESPAAAQPLAQGILLYQGLKQVSKLAIVIDYPDGDKLEHWLATHGLRDHALVVRNPREDDPAEGRQEMLTSVRQLGQVDLAVEGDVALAARMLHLGVPTLLASNPAYTRLEFRPDATRVGRPWAELTEEIEAQAALRESDKRVTADVAGTRYEDD